MASSSRAVMTALAAVLLALASLGGPYAVAAMVVILGCTFAVGWPILVAAPAQLGSSIVIGAAAIVSVAVVVITGAPAYLSLVVAFGVTAAFLQQMLRSDDRENLVGGLSTTVTGIVVVTSGSGWLLAIADRAGDETVLSALVILVLASLVTSLPSRTLIVAGVAALLGSGFGVGLGAYLPNLSISSGFLVGLVAGGMMALAHLALGAFPAVLRWSAATAAAVLPVLVLGIPIHLVASMG